MKKIWANLTEVVRHRSIFIVGSLAIVCCTCLLVLISNYTPVELGPNGILFFFLLLYVAILCTCGAVIAGLLKLLRREASIKKLIYVASVLSFAPVLLLALNTINQLQVLDLVLVVIFEVLAIFYISRHLG